MTLTSWYVFVVFRAVGYISEATHAYMMQVLPWQIACIFWLNRRVNKSINIAFSVTMELQ